jgi:hypothetical protein
VTTNLCARGIDVEQVTVVVNYDVPVDVNKRPDCETYLHRYLVKSWFGCESNTFFLSGLAALAVSGEMV